MKILQVIHCFPPESMTGSEIYAYNLSKSLSKTHKVTVFYRINNTKKEEYKIIRDSYNGLDVYKINNTLRRYNSLEKIYKNRAIEEKFSQVLDEIRPDIVHIHHLLFLSTGIIDEIKKHNIPIVFTLHDYWLVCPRGQLLKSNLRLCKEPGRFSCIYCMARALNLKNLLSRLVNFSIRKNILFKSRIREIYGKVDLFISPSLFLRNKFIKLGMPSRKIIYCNNGIGLGLFEDIQKTRADKIRFGFIGTLISSKGIHVLIKAFKGIKQNNMVLKIYGTSPKNNGIFNYFNRVKNMARSNRHIRFMGTFNNKDIAGIFSNIDVLVVPSIWPENSPMVIQEAFESQTPVIASNIGGIPELVRDDVNGLLFKSGDVSDLRQKLKYVTDNPELLQKWRKNIPKVKDIEDNARELEKIYYSLLQSGQGIICQH